MPHRKIRTAVTFSATATAALLLTQPHTAFAAAPAGSDLNGDTYGELAAGLPAMADNGLAGSGQLPILAGSATGPTADGGHLIGQASPGIPGAAEPGDGFGTETAFGNINGDAYADLAIAAPAEDDTTGVADIGAITVLYGKADGTLTPHPVHLNLPETERTQGDRLGQSIAIADFNNDGLGEIAAWAPGGSVLTVFDKDDLAQGSPTTSIKLTPAADTGAGTQAISELNSLAAGDFDNDGYSDLALTYRTTDGTDPLILIYGSASGLATGDIFPLGVPGGADLASGDTDGDGTDDLVVGQPDPAAAPGIATGGQITTYYGSAAGITTTDNTVLHQASTDVEGTNEPGDEMGASVAVADIGGDGIDDVLTGRPGEDITTSGTDNPDAGSGLYLPGSATGPTGTGSIGISQASGGVPGAAEPGDRHSAAVSLTDTDGDGQADAMLGVPGEDAGHGTTLHIPGAASGPVLASAKYYGLGALGVPADGPLAIGGILAP